MREGRPSLTARRVALHRLTFERIAVDFGDPAADDALAADVAHPEATAGGDDTDGNGAEPATGEWLVQYLRGRTTFFDRVVVNALERGIRQFVAIGAGYDGRSLRYSKRGVRWFEVDHRCTQVDKVTRLRRLGIRAPQTTFIAADLREPGFAENLIAHGLEPDAPALITCEGVIVYLAPDAVGLVFDELRATVTPGTRFAFSASAFADISPTDERRQRFEAAVAAAGEPARSRIGGEELDSLLATTRWRSVELSDRATRAGFRVAAPDWSRARLPHAPATRSAVGAFMERLYGRAGTDGLGDHLQSIYGTSISRVDQLDVGAFRVARPDGDWIARVFQRERPIDAARGDADLLARLAEHDFPAERAAADDPISVLDGQAVLITQRLAGRRPPRTDDTYRGLGRLLGWLQELPDAAGITRPGGAWHHIVGQGSPREEIDATLALVRAAQARVPSEEQELHGALVERLARIDDCAHLPQALIHPDCVPENAIALSRGPEIATSRDARIALIDWSGAGIGPRVWAVGWLLWAAGLQHAHAVIDGYRSESALDQNELHALPDAIAARPLLFTARSFADGSKPLADVIAGISAIDAAATGIARAVS